MGQRVPPMVPVARLHGGEWVIPAHMPPAPPRPPRDPSGSASARTSCLGCGAALQPRHRQCSYCLRAV